MDMDMGHEPSHSSDMATHKVCKNKADIRLINTIILIKKSKSLKAFLLILQKSDVLTRIPHV